MSLGKCRFGLLQNRPGNGYHHIESVLGQPLPTGACLRAEVRAEHARMLLPRLENGAEQRHKVLVHRP